MSSIRRTPHEVHARRKNSCFSTHLAIRSNTAKIRQKRVDLASRLDRILTNDERPMLESSTGTPTPYPNKLIPGAVVIFSGRLPAQ